LIQILQNIQLKLLLSIISLLLLVIVTYTEPFLQKALAQSDAHIVAAGDWGCSDNTEKTVQNAKSMSPQLLLGLGDFSYDKTATCWFDIIKPVNSITKINIGNHETDGESLLNSYLNHFGLSKQFYSFDVKNVHVLTMATEEELGKGSEQYNFVVNDLRKVANNPDIKWIIVSLHAPFYTSPNGCKASHCEGHKEAREIFHPLFDKYGVDLVLQGHVHNYQRSLPLKFNQESPSKPLVTSISKSDYKNPDGAIFAIVGTGGVNLHSVSDKASFIAYQEDSKFGILDMHFSDNKLDAKFVTNEGSTLDHFSISKTVKKIIVERISDNVISDDKAKPLSDKEDKPAATTELSDDAVTDDKAKPLSDKEDKPAVTAELSDDAAVSDDKAKPLSDKEDKPAATTEPSDDIVTIDKLKSLLHKEDGKSNELSDKGMVTDDKPIPLSDEGEIPLSDKEDKPTATTELGDDAAVTDDKAKPLSDEEDKPAVTTEPSDDAAVTDDKPIPLSDEGEIPLSDKEDKPAVTTEPSDDAAVTDDKAKPLSDEEDKPEVSEDKTTSHQNSEDKDKSPVEGLLEPLDNTDPIDDDGSDPETTINTNEKDPFAALD
jgi:hypothetical protein